MGRGGVNFPRGHCLNNKPKTISVHAVAGILRRGNTVLIAERPEGRPYSGYWEFPGGKIETGETGREALVRELHEELGIEVISVKHLFDHSHVYPDKNVLLEIWLVDQFNGEPHGRESQALRWVTLADMSGLRLLEGNWPIVDRMKQFFS